MSSCINLKMECLSSKKGLNDVLGMFSGAVADMEKYMLVECNLNRSIGELDKTMKEHGLELPDHKNFKTYVEVISFDRLVNAAKERNRAFFDQLGLPST